MRTETITRELYQFEELEDDAKESARNWYREGMFDFEWWQDIYYDATQIGLEITSFDDYKAEGKLIKTGAVVCSDIMKNHGKGFITYKLAKMYLPLFEKWAEDENEGEYQTEQTEDEFLSSLLEDYRITLNKEYEHMCSDEYIDENIIMNDHEFTKDGKHA